MEKQRIYFCIDAKSFFASVECAERGLNPFETNLVVADPSRGSGAICLAISPKMKALGAKNRCRIFEIPKNIKYITALPRMKKYIEYAADIYSIYLQYIDKRDIHVYSIDESFIDATDYLKIYKKTPKEFTKMLIDEIAEKTMIPSTVGIGTNLYLAKIALDIISKKCSDRIGYLDEKLYRDLLWNHTPITDFWQVAKGIARRLEKYGIYDMQGVANCSSDRLYKEFGINAELLIDHAWGRESCTMDDIKNYKSKSKSVSTSQILFSDYTFDKAKIVMEEMVQSGAHEMMRQNVVTNRINIFIGYSKDIIPSARGHIKMTATTNIAAVMMPYVSDCFERMADKNTLIRRLGIEFVDVVDECCEGYDLFTNFEQIEHRKAAERTVLKIHDKFGKNALIRAASLQDGATMRIRNRLIGGHNGE